MGRELLVQVRIGVVEHSLLQARVKDRECSQRNLTLAVREDTKRGGAGMEVYI